MASLYKRQKVFINIITYIKCVFINRATSMIILLSWHGYHDVVDSRYVYIPAIRFSGCDCPNAILVKRINAIKDWVGTSTLETFIRRGPSARRPACRIGNFSTRLCLVRNDIDKGTTAVYRTRRQFVEK